MKILRGDLPTHRAPAQWFTGDVYVDTITVEKFGLNAAMVHGACRDAASAGVWIRD